MKFADEIPEEECRKCPFACCGHPSQRIFTKYEDSWETYRKICIKSLSKVEIKKIIAAKINHGCYKGSIELIS